MKSLYNSLLLNLNPFVVCEKCYFLGEEYVDHMKTHIVTRHEHDVRNGIKLMQKLFDENHYGLHQCLYCVYGTKNEGN